MEKRSMLWGDKWKEEAGEQTDKWLAHQHAVRWTSQQLQNLICGGIYGMYIRRMD